MLTNLNPNIVFIEDKYINVENLDHFITNLDHLFITLDYSNGDKDVLRFGSIFEFKRAVHKLNRAQKDLNFGTVAM